MEKIKNIIENIKNENYLIDEIVYLLETSNQAEINYLYNEANKQCLEVYGENVFIRSILELSNNCSKNCNYCGIRKGNSNIERYRIEPDDAIKLAKEAYEVGYKTLVIQSGEDAYYDNKLEYILKEIKKAADIAITLSVGEKDFELYEKWKQAGADRFLLRIETTNEHLFNQIHPDDNLEYRKKCLYNLKKLDYEVGTGIMIGLPGQTYEMIAKDILFFKELDADMIGVGPFIPHKDTPLKNVEPKDFEITLKVVAITRLVTKNANIPATTAMGTIDKEGRQKALKVGANVIMPNFTPQSYRPFYKLYDNKICINEGSNECRACIDGIAGAAGKKIIIDKGFRNKI